jgi:phosphate transport system substrate-binding protein
VNRTLRIAAVAAVGAGSLVGAASALANSTGSGATFPQVAYQKWCGESKVCSYTGKGSSGGIRDLTNKTVDWAGSDAVLTEAQLAAIGGTVKYFPTLLGAISVPVNIPGVVGNKMKLDGKTLGDIWSASVTTWNAPQIKKLNPKLALPASPITLCVRSDGSGTSYGFSNYLSKVSPAFRSKVGFGSQTPAWQGTLVKSPGNPGVANCVKNTPNSIGYVDLADSIRAGLQENVTAIGKSEIVKKGKKTVRATVFVLPSPTTISKAGDVKTIKPTLDIDLTNSPAAGAYPITITTWVLAVPGRPTNGKVKDVLGYFYGNTAQSQLTGLGFAPLPGKLKKAAIVAAAALN